MQDSSRQITADSSGHPVDAASIMLQLAANSREKRYTWLPVTARQLGGGSEQEARVVRAVLTQLVTDFTLENAPLRIPDSIAGLYERELGRIRSVIDADDPASLRFDLDVRQKDIAILTFRFIPVGAEFAEPWSAIWKRRALTARLGQIFRAGYFFLLKRNGFSPYFQLHLHQESHEEFNEEGWMRTYMRLAELLEANPDHRGWFSCSWFVDPALEQISPHLSYLRTVPAKNGGAIFYMEDDPESRTGALLTSKTRRHMFEEGRYLPRVYMRVWPRSPAIAWWKERVSHPGPNRET